MKDVRAQIMEGLQVLGFDPTALERWKNQGNLWLGIVFVLLAIFLQSIPFEQAFHMSFLWSAIRVFGGILVLYVVIKILSSESHFEFDKFLFGVSLVCFLGLVLSWVIIGLGFLVFQMGLGWAGTASFLISLKKIYTLLLFAFSTETLSGLKGWKGIVAGLVAVCIWFVLAYLI